jgi:hypothetical protein
MSEWEYDLFAFQSIDSQSLKIKLNSMGKEGWEYCGQSAFPVENGLMFMYMFKRPAKLVKAASSLIGAP